MGTEISWWNFGRRIALLLFITALSHHFLLEVAVYSGVFYGLISINYSFFIV